MTAPDPITRLNAALEGPHLHWVVRYGLTSVDPRSLMAVSAEVTPPGA